MKDDCFFLEKLTIFQTLHNSMTKNKFAIPSRFTNTLTSKGETINKRWFTTAVKVSYSWVKKPPVLPVWICNFSNNTSAIFKSFFFFFWHWQSWSLAKQGSEDPFPILHGQQVSWGSVGYGRRQRASLGPFKAAVGIQSLSRVRFRIQISYFSIQSGRPRTCRPGRRLSGPG